MLLAILPVASAEAAPAMPGKAQMVPAALRSLAPVGMTRGGTHTLTMTGINISDATGVFFDDGAISGRVVLAADPAAKRNEIRVDVTVGAVARPGVHRVFLQTPLGATGSVTFAVSAWPEVTEKEPSDGSAATPLVSLPATLVGKMDVVGDRDDFRFRAEAGQELVFEVIAAGVRSKLNAVLALKDERGRLLAENNDAEGRLDALLGYRFATAGTYTLTLRDFENGGGSEFYYRLNIGAAPYVRGVFPLGIPAGRTSEVALTGFNLASRRVAVTAPPKPLWGQTLPVPLDLPAEPPVNPARVAVGRWPEVTEAADAPDEPTKAQPVALPVTINGRIFHTGELPDVDVYRFRARKGETLVLEVGARRLGSPLDAVIEVLDTRGQPVERATLRPVAQTAITLSDPDSARTGFRLLSWTDLAINDYVFCRGELLRVAALPRGPDDDLRFRSFRGQRIGYLDTTPGSHSVHTPVYKVQIHPPGAIFPPNGMPLFRLFYRNDDGGALYGKDSRLTFTPPADGDYLVRIRDVRGQQGEDYAYRLELHPPRPDFRLTMSPEHPNVPRGGSVPIDVTVDRLDGCDGEIRVRLEGLPPGFTATEATIEAGETSATLTLSAASDAVTPALPVPSPIRLLGTARVAGQPVTRTLEPPDGRRLLTVLPAADIGVATDLPRVALRPGGQVELVAKVERRHGFGGRIPIDVRNLPFGVRVMDVGLNGVLVTEQETSRRFVLYAEPWVQPQTRPLYAVGRVESDPASEHAAAAVMLEVVGATTGAAIGAGGR